MVLRHLSLTHFRNYQRLELDLSGVLTLIQGQNAQGKTNLLEAIYFLATSKPLHAVGEREVVDWLAAGEPIPFARAAALVESDGRDIEIEILLSPREDGGNFRKQVRVNGVNRRAMDLVGLMRVVLFLPEDIRLVDGTPGDRRRYLDIALCQMDRGYCRALSHYQKVLEQRNSLLRALRDRESSPGEPAVEAQLGFWDEQLVTHGSIVVAGRHHLLAEASVRAQAIHAELSDGRERLDLQYVPSFNPGCWSDADFTRLDDEIAAAELATHPPRQLDVKTVAQHFHARIQQRRSREMDAGNTLYGPHRDDFRFLVNGRDLRLYGSRGQQRSAALALKLAEVDTMTRRTGSSPILLLDDVMSELDERRRATLLNTLNSARQVILTTTDLDDFSPDFRARARLLRVEAGALIEGNGVGP